MKGVALGFSGIWMRNHKNQKITVANRPKLKSRFEFPLMAATKVIIALTVYLGLTRAYPGPGYTRALHPGLQGSAELKGPGTL